MKEKINLTDDLFIARGGEREVYQHPFDFTKVIKILYKKNGVYTYNGARNKIEYMYFKFLQKSQVPFTHIARCYDYLDTNLGEGLVYDKVFDYDKKTSLDFSTVIKEKLLSEDIEDLLIKELKSYIFKYDILFIDYGIDNILCCEYEKGKYRLIVIDGLGARRLGFKFYLYLNSKLYRKYKVRTQWRKANLEIESMRNARK